MTEPALPDRSWAEVDTGTLRANARALAAHAGAPLLAPLKANAYGHGLTGVAGALAGEAAVWGFALAQPAEALALRAAGVELPLLVLGATDPAEQRVLARAGVAVTVGHPDELADLPPDAAVHLKVNTGMHRFGVRPGAAPALARALAARGQLAGIMTHFASADADDLGPARAQLDAFRELRGALADLTGVRWHAANSAGLLAFGREAAFDTVRPGIALYGYPHALLPGLRPALRWAARVLAVQRVRAGEAVGYGGAWVAPADTDIAVLAAGYADGLPRAPGRAVLLGGERRSLRGRVCMDVCLADATGLGVRRGDTATLLSPEPGDRLGAAEVCGDGGIPHAVLTAIGARVRRRFI